jgi:hypothetical protein
MTLLIGNNIRRACGRSYQIVSPMKSRAPILNAVFPLHALRLIDGDSWAPVELSVQSHLSTGFLSLYRRSGGLASGVRGQPPATALWVRAPAADSCLSIKCKKGKGPNPLKRLDPKRHFRAFDRHDRAVERQKGLALLAVVCQSPVR